MSSAFISLGECPEETDLAGSKAVSSGIKPALRSPRSGGEGRNINPAIL